MMKFTSLLLLLLMLTACAVREIPQPTPTLLPMASATLSATDTPPVAASPTASETPTPVASPTITATPVLVVERGELAPGFSLTVYAKVPIPTSLTFGPNGKLYVASFDGNIYVLDDADGDQRATRSSIFTSGLDTPLGLLWIGDTLYISYKENVVAMQDTDGNGVQDKFEIIVPNLPTGLHQNDGMVLGADGFIYMGLGSTCDVCEETDPRSASIVRFKPDGSEFSVYAHGFRNPYDVAFNAAGDLFATDNGRDKLGKDLPLEELNLVREGQHYGWPDCWEGNTVPECTEKAGAAATFTAHSSVDGLVFYNGTNFPQEYQDNAFVAVLGSYLYTEIERGVKRVKLSDGKTLENEWFLKFTDSGRPLDLTVGPDGGLYVADYENNAIYRIVYGAP